MGVLTRRALRLLVYTRALISANDKWVLLLMVKILHGRVHKKSGIYGIGYVGSCWVCSINTRTLEGAKSLPSAASSPGMREEDVKVLHLTECVSSWWLNGTAGASKCMHIYKQIDMNTSVYLEISIHMYE